MIRFAPLFHVKSDVGDLTKSQKSESRNTNRSLLQVKGALAHFCDRSLHISNLLLEGINRLKTSGQIQK